MAHRDGELMRCGLGLILKLHVLLALARYGMQDDSTVNYFIFAWHQLWHSGRGRPSISWRWGFESLLFFSFFFLSFFLFPSCPKSGLKRSWIYKQGKRYSKFNPQLCCLGLNNQLWRKKGRDSNLNPTAGVDLKGCPAPLSHISKFFINKPFLFSVEIISWWNF